MRPVRAVRTLALVGFAASAASCSRRPADPVAALLAELEAAAEARDADAFAARLSADFTGEGGAARADTIGDLQRYFAAYETVAIEMYGVETERRGAEANVRCAGRRRRTRGGERSLQLTYTAVFE